MSTDNKFEKLLAEAIPESTVTEMPIADIHVSIDENIRDEASYVTEEIAELAANIEATGGLLQPVGVAQCKPTEETSGKEFSLIYGFRRMLAIQDLQAKYPDDPKWQNVRCQVYKIKSIGMLKVLQLAENANRKQLNPMETAKTLKTILNAEPGMTQERAAKMLGISIPNASQMLKLLTLPQDIQDDVSQGKIPFSSARKLVYEVPEKHWPEAANIARQYAYVVFAAKMDRMYGKKADGDATESDGKEGETAGPKQARMARSTVLVGRVLPYLQGKLKTAKTEKAFSEADVIKAKIEAVEAVLLTENNPLNKEMQPFMEEQDKKEEADKAKEKNEKSYKKFLRTQTKAAEDMLKDTSNLSDPNAKRPSQAECIGAVAKKVQGMKADDLTKLEFPLDVSAADFIKKFTDDILADWAEMDADRKKRKDAAAEAKAKEEAEAKAKKDAEDAKTKATPAAVTA